MKDIPIKFRAKETIKGEYVYGDLIHCGDDVCIREHTTVDMFLTHEGDTKIDPDSVAQLVGYDKNGAEVYEGDTIINEYDYAVDFEKAIAKAGTRRACLAFETYIDWFDKPIRNFLTTEQQLKKRADYIKGFVKGDSNEQT